MACVRFSWARGCANRRNSSDVSLLDWLTLYRACGTGSVGATQLIEAAGGDVHIAAFRLALSKIGPGKHAAAALAAQGDFRWVQAHGASVLTIADADYPELLKATNGAPLLLFVRGNRDVLALPQLAIVGSRHASAGGLATARDFAASFAQRGFCVVSGLAAGIDTAAHQGALSYGSTIAVFGTGIDQVYPASNSPLAEAILSKGAWVSEFPPGTAARKTHFPRRNRIISGLSMGTLVVEASLGSGSLITARRATEQGREVFAIPGSIHNPLAKGCHQLIRDGAKLVETAQEVMDELSPYVRDWQLRTSHLIERRGSDRTGSEDPEYASVRAALGFDPVSIDALAERTSLTIPVLSSMLLQMELAGEVILNAGGSYSRAIG